MLMVSLSTSGKQKIAATEDMKQFTRRMEIFLIIQINKNIPCRMTWIRYSSIIIIIDIFYSFNKLNGGSEHVVT